MEAAACNQEQSNDASCTGCFHCVLLNRSLLTAKKNWASVFFTHQRWRVFATLEPQSQHGWDRVTFKPAIESTFSTAGAPGEL